MRYISPGKAAAALGAATGALHFVWSMLVASGTAKAVLDFILMLHFMSIDIQMQPFNIRFAIVLIALTAAIGAAFGFVLALVWNALAGARRPVSGHEPRHVFRAG